MALVIYLGNRGVFLKHTRWLSNLAGFVLVLTIPAVLFGAIDVAREGLVLAASHTSNFQLASGHVLRLLAIGTVIKCIQGQLPLHFVIFGSGISMFFSVPSPFRIYRDHPDTSLVFQFPMLLAPNFTVPLFALAHVFALVKLFTS